MKNIINPDDSEIFTKLWRVSLGRFADTGSYFVHADNEEDALDEVVDYCEKQGFEGYFLSKEEGANMHDEEVENYVIAGNHGRYIAESECVRVERCQR